MYHVACYEDAKVQTCLCSTCTLASTVVYLLPAIYYNAIVVPQESEGRPSVAVANEQNKAVEVPEKGSNDNTGIDENVEQQSTSVVIESEKRDENRPTTAS